MKETLTKMKIIIKGQKNIIENLEDANNKMIQAAEFVNQGQFNKIEKHILFVLLQDFLFSFNDEVLKNKELFEIMENLPDKFSRRKIDFACKNLEARDFLVKVSKNPIAYRLNVDNVPIFN